MFRTKIPNGEIVNDEIFQDGWGQVSSRKIGDVKDGDVQKSVEFFERRYKQLHDKIHNLIENIRISENKGSFLMQLIHLKKALPEHDGLGDYQSLHILLVKSEEDLTSIISDNRKRNTILKKELIAEAEQIETVLNWKEASEKAKDLKERWIKIGHAEEAFRQELENSFWDQIQDFYQRKKQFYEDKAELIKHRERQYQGLVKEAKALQNTSDGRADKINQLNERWKNVGGVPSSVYEPLNKAFRSCLEPINRKVKQESVSYDVIKQKLDRWIKDSTLGRHPEIRSIK
ncbi:MAG: DUF349 domain-containing protein, partial [Bacteroidota bacterium]